MDSGLLIALGFAAAIVVLAVLLTRLVARPASRRDINGSKADGRASATWIGIRTARGDMGEAGDRDG